MSGITTDDIIHDLKEKHNIDKDFVDNNLGVIREIINYSRLIGYSEGYKSGCDNVVYKEF